MTSRWRVAGDTGGGVRGARSGAPTCRHGGRRVGPHPRDQPWGSYPWAPLRSAAVTPPPNVRARDAIRARCRLSPALRRVSWRETRRATSLS